MVEGLRGLVGLMIGEVWWRVLRALRGWFGDGWGTRGRYAGGMGRRCRHETGRVGI